MRASARGFWLEFFEGSIRGLEFFEGSARDVFVDPVVDVGIESVVGRVGVGWVLGLGLGWGWGWGSWGWTGAGV